MNYPVNVGTVLFSRDYYDSAEGKGVLSLIGFKTSKVASDGPNGLRVTGESNIFPAIDEGDLIPVYTLKLHLEAGCLTVEVEKGG